MKFKIPFAFLVLFFLCRISTSYGANINWVGGNSVWNVASNWSPAQIPTTADDVFINGSVVATVSAGFTAVAKSISLSNGAQLTVFNTATLTVGTVPSSSNCISLETNCILENAGEILVEGNTADHGIYCDECTIDNLSNGMISISGSTVDGLRVENEGSVNNAGSLSTSSTGSDGIRHITGIFTNSGTVDLSNANLIGLFLEESTLNNTGSVSIGSGTVADGIGITEGILNNFSGGMIDIDDVGIHGIENEEGEINNTGTINISNTFGHGILNDGGSMVNTGIINMTAGIGMDGINCVGSGLEALNQEGGQINITHATNDGIHLIFDYDFSNAGIITFGAGIGGQDIDYTDVSGTIPSFTNESNTGEIKGTGTINGSEFVSNGAISPGFSAGTINVSNNYTASNSNVLNIELGGTTAGTEHDQLTVAGTANLNGTLNVTLLGSYTPSSGNEFVIVDAGTAVSGNFITVNLPSVSGLTFSVSYTGTQVVIKVVAPGVCLDFGDANDRVSMPAAMTGSGDFTVDFWFKSPGYQDAKVIFRWQQNGRFEIRMDANKIGVYQHHTSGGSGHQYSNYTVTSGVWHHFALTRNATECKLYANGNVVKTFTPVFEVGPSIQLFHYNGGGFDAIGEMDELRVWNNVLTQTEIQAVMGCELTGSEDCLIGYWDFNIGTADGNNTGLTSLPDLSGNGNHGTLFNFALNGTTSNWTSPSTSVSGTCSGATCLALLPVEFANFYADKKGEHIQLEWETQSEINNSHFEVEHSTDGQRFYIIGKINGAGSSLTAQGYNFLHKNPTAGINYYRLKTNRL